jgi:hypothetical protein
VRAPKDAAEAARWAADRAEAEAEPGWPERSARIDAFHKMIAESKKPKPVQPMTPERAALLERVAAYWAARPPQTKCACPGCRRGGPFPLTGENLVWTVLYCQSCLDEEAAGFERQAYANAAAAKKGLVAEDEDTEDDADED